MEKSNRGQMTSASSSVRQGFEYLREVYEKYNRPLDCDPEASKIA